MTRAVDLSNDNAAERFGVIRSELMSFVLLLCLACSGSSPGTDILLITVDTLRPDHLGIYGYERPTSPNIDRFFRRGMVFENSYSTDARTPPSVISVLSGQLPQHHGVRRFIQLVPDDTELIPDLLPAKYQTAGFVANAVLTDQAIGVAGRFDHFDDYIDTKEQYHPGFERSAERTTDAALKWLEDERDPERPAFLWIHYMDPHSPYLPPEDWQRSFTHDEPVLVSSKNLAALTFRAHPGGAEALEGEYADGLVFVDAYDEEIAYLDSQVGRLLDWYEGRHPVEEALVLLTADHGESMIEHELYFAHGYHVHEELIRVPLLMRGPGAREGRCSGLVSGIDLAPTIVRFAGASIPEELQGLDLRQARAIEPERIVFAETRIKGYPGNLFRSRFWRAAIQGQRKWLLGFSMDSTKLEEQHFVDLRSDPGELTQQAWRDGAAATRLVQLDQADTFRGEALKKIRKGRRPTEPIVDPRATEEQRETLRALGYLE